MSESIPRNGNIDAWHGLVATVGPILKAAFPDEHAVTRLQAAWAIATELEPLCRPRFGEPGREEEDG